MSTDSRSYRRAARIAAVLLAASTLAPLAAAQEPIAFGGRQWTVRGQPVRVEEVGGREALRMRSAVAYLEGVTMENGTIELEVWTSGERSFIGVAFRIQDDGRSYEDFYLRPHNSGRFDAMQYTPVENGASAWQLYPEHNASYVIPTERWLPVKLVIAGPRLEVFLDGAAEPSLRVDRLARGRSVGRIAVRAFFPGGEPEDHHPTAFANVTVRPDAGGHPYPDAAGPPADSGLVASWALSPPVPAPEDLETYPAARRAAGPWTTAVADVTGRVNLARYGGIPEGSRRGTVLARLVLRAERARRVPLRFGFSDRATVFLNGEPLFAGDNTYLSRSQRYLGVMTVDHQTVFLPLARGDNELLIQVTEAFGGWGLIARLPDRTGIAVRAAPP